MVGTRIPKDALVEPLTEKNGVKYIIESGAWAANEAWFPPEGAIMIEHESSDHPKDSRDWFNTIYLLPLQKTKAIKTPHYVCESKVASMDKVFLLPKNASIIDISKTCPLSCEGYKYKIMYLIPRQPEKPFEGFEYL